MPFWWLFIHIFFQVAVFKSIANKKFHGKSYIKWLPTDGGFTEHVISTSSEWILAILLMFILISFVPDFKEIQMHQPMLHDPRVASSKQFILD